MSDPNSILDSCFPLVEVAKSATPSGSELMARTGHSSNETKGPGRTGRPRKNELAGLRQHSVTLKKGTKLRLLLPDDKTIDVVLLVDTLIAPWNY